MPDAPEDNAKPSKAAKAGAAADAAVAEVDAQEDGKATDLLEVTHAGVTFTLSRKKLDSIQFRRLMQRSKDLLALEWLLTAPVLSKLINAMADEDGITSEAEFDKVWDAIGEAVGAGNS